MFEPMVMWGFFVGLIIHRLVFSLERVQRRVHRLSWPWLWQWYTVTMLLLGFFLLRTFYDVVKYDICGYSFLASPLIQRNIDSIKDSQGRPLSDEEKMGLGFSTWLRWLAIATPFLSVVAFLLIAVHIWLYARCVIDKSKAQLNLKRERGLSKPCHELRDSRVRCKGELATIIQVDVEENLLPYKVETESGVQDWVGKEELELVFDTPLHWHFQAESDLALLVIIMPAFFVVMALRAEIRILEIMTGEWAASPAGQRIFATWDEVKLTYSSLYTTDLELGSAFQFLTVWAFARLCCRHLHLGHMVREVQDRLESMSLELNRRRSHSNDSHLKDVRGEILNKLRKASDEQQSSLVWAGMQGIWAYIFVGAVRTLFDMAEATLKTIYRNEEAAMVLQEQVLTRLGPVFAFSALLCVYNSTIIFGMTVIKDENALGKWANLKFLGTRILLLLCQFQPVILSVVGDKAFGFSCHQERLTNATLLSAECLIVAGFNFWSLGDWRQSSSYETSPPESEYHRLEP